MAEQEQEGGLPILQDGEEYVVAKGASPHGRRLHRRVIGEEQAVCKIRGPKDKVPVFIVVDEQVAGYTEECNRCWPELGNWRTGPTPQRAYFKDKTPDV